MGGKEQRTEKNENFTSKVSEAVRRDQRSRGHYEPGAERENNRHSERKNKQWKTTVERLVLLQENGENEKK